MTDNDIKKIVEPPFYYDEGSQFIFDQKGVVVDIRMWGRLTGQGAMNLPEKEAVELQDAFGELLAKLLNEWYNTQNQKQG